MLFHINTQELIHALSSVVPIADMGQTLELSCVYIEARNGEVRFSVTDMNNSVRHTKAALISEEGTCLVSARKLHGVVKTFPDAAIEVSASDKEVKVKCGKISVDLPALDPKRFDPLVFVDTANGISMPFSTFSEITKMCVHCASTKDDRPTLTCVHIATKGDKLVFESTDSFKVIEVSISFNGAEIDALVPAGFISKVAALKAGKTINFAVDHNQIAFSDGEIEMGSSLNMGKFPNVEAVLKNTVLFNALVDVSTLKTALNRAVSIHANVVKLEADDGLIKVTGISDDDGTTYEEIACETSGDTSAKIYLSSNLLMQFVSSLCMQRVSVGLCGELKPLYVDSGTSRGIVMPVRAPEGW